MSSFLILKLWFTLFLLLIGAVFVGIMMDDDSWMFHHVSWFLFSMVFWILLTVAFLIWTSK